MNFSILPILYLIQIGIIYRVVRKTQNLALISAEQSNLVNLLLMMLTIWGGVSTYLGLSGYYQSGAFLSSLPGFWVTQVAVLLVMFPWMVSKNLRQGIDTIIDQTPLHLIMGFEGLRSLALGGIYK